VATGAEVGLHEVIAMAFAENGVAVAVYEES